MNPQTTWDKHTVDRWNSKSTALRQEQVIKILTWGQIS